MAYTDFSHVLHLKMISLETSSYGEIRVIQGLSVPSNLDWTLLRQKIVPYNATNIKESFLITVLQFQMQK